MTLTISDACETRAERRAALCELITSALDEEFAGEGSVEALEWLRRQAGQGADRT
jgi:hypothetical protein